VPQHRKFAVAGAPRRFPEETQMPAKARYFQYFGEFWPFVVESQQEADAESEKSARESFIFRP